MSLDNARMKMLVESGNIHYWSPGKSKEELEEARAEKRRKKVARFEKKLAACLTELGISNLHVSRTSNGIYLTNSMRVDEFAEEVAEAFHVIVERDDNGDH